MASLSVFGKHLRADRQRTRTLSTAAADPENLQALRSVRVRARAAFEKHMGVLEDIATGNFEVDSVSRTTLPDGRVQETVTTIRPTPKDRLAALEQLGRYGRIPTSPDGEGVGGSVDPGKMLVLLVTALRDPAVRRWVEETHPEAVAGLRAVAAEEVEAQVLPTVEG